MDEVAAGGGVEPRGAYDVGFVPDGAGVEFTGRFGAAVGVGGIDRHPLFIGGGIPAVEHLIGADLDEGDVLALAGEGEVLGAEAVGTVGQLRLFDTAVYIGIGCAIDDDIGGCITDKRGDTGFVADVVIRQIDGRDLVIDENLLQRLSQLPVAASYEDMHGSLISEENMIDVC